MEPKPLSETSDKRFALLIDADNVSARYIKPILNELSKYGTVTIKRIYGDWTLTLHSKWKDALLENSITPIQQFGYTQGKNATDSAMIIDAMDLLYTDNVDGFCLVSSDSDFTRLASRLRESGRMVIGMGEKKTPVPFRRACDVFTTLELLVQNKRERSGSGSGNGGSAVPKDAVEQAVVDIITDNQNNGKSTGLGEIGSRLQKRYPDFDVRSYGTNLLSKLLEEFTRVRIIKDHSSVTVELADGSDERGERADKPAKGERPSRAAKAPKQGKTEKDEGTPGEAPAEREGTEDAPAPSDEASAADGSAEAAGEAEGVEKPGRRSRSHRGTRRVTPRADDRSAEGDAPVDALSKATSAGEDVPEEAARDMRPGRKARAQRKTQMGDAAPEQSGRTDAPAETPVPEPEAPASAAKPRRARKKAAVAADAPAAASGDAPASEESQPKRRGRKKTAEPSAPAAEAAPAPEEPQPKKRGRKPAEKATTPKTKAPAKSGTSAKAKADASTPQGAIYHMVAEAGADGVMLSTITDALRAKFKDFKVRDLGYSQMRQYMAAAGEYDLEQSGRNLRVRLAR